MPRLTALAALLVCTVLAFASAASAAEVEPGPLKHPQPPKRTPHGKLIQLPGPNGCIDAASANAKGCARARPLAGPGVGFGSHAIATTPDGRSVYVAASKSNAITVFARDPQTGTLKQPQG